MGSNGSEDVWIGIASLLSSWGGKSGSKACEGSLLLFERFLESRKWAQAEGDCLPARAKRAVLANMLVLCVRFED